MLIAIARNKGSALTKEEVIDLVWGTGVTVTDNNLNVTLRAVRKALGESGRDPQYIATTSGCYRILAGVTEVSDEEILPNGGAIAEKTTHPSSVAGAGQRNAHLERLFGGHSFHVLSSCFLYASLYGLALLTEVAYQFDHYRCAEDHATGCLLDLPDFCSCFRS